MNRKPKPHPEGYKFPLFKPVLAEAFLDILSDTVIQALFAQSIVQYRKGEPYTEGLRRYTRLVEAELQERLRSRLK